MGVFVVVLVVVAMVPVANSSSTVSPTVPGDPRDTDVVRQTGPEDGFGQSRNATSGVTAPTCGTYSQSYPDDPAAFIAKIETAGNESMYQQYGELATIRSLATSKLQIGRFTDKKEAEMRLVLDLLRSYQESYELAQNGSIESSLTTARRADSCIASLQDRGVEYASLGSIALDRFYQSRGRELQERANEVEETPKRIQRLELAAEAYRRGGATQRFSQTTLRAKRLRTEYRRELSVMNTSEGSVSQFLNRCSNCDDPVSTLRTQKLDVFSRYVGAERARGKITEAQSLASEHGLSERRQRYVALSDQVGTVRFSLAVAAAAIVEGYAIVIALLAMFVGHRISAWRETVENSRVGDVVLQEGDFR
jgi:hypothetical protein